MYKSVAAGVALLGMAITVTAPAWAQGAPRTCSEAYTACTSRQVNLAKDCEAEKQWCLKTGSFADPKTKSVTTNMQKK